MEREGATASGNMAGYSIAALVEEFSFIIHEIFKEISKQN